MGLWSTKIYFPKNNGKEGLIMVRAQVVGVISIATSDKEIVKLFKKYQNVETKTKLLWNIARNQRHVLFYDYDGVTFKEAIENTLMYQEIINEKLGKDLDLYILQSSKDGFHIISPEMFNFETINSMISYYPDTHLDKKLYPNLKERDYDLFATLRISPKLSLRGTIEYKERPKLKAILLCKKPPLISKLVSSGHLRLFDLPIFTYQQSISTFPIIVHYTTGHRVV